MTFSEPVTVTGTPQLALKRAAARWPITPAAAARRRSPSPTPWRPGRTRPTWIMPRPRRWRSTAARSRMRRATRPCLTLPATGTDGLATQNIVIDTTPPTVTGVSSTQPTGIVTGRDGDPDHGHVQRTGHGDGNAATGRSNDGGGGQLHQRQRHGDAHLHLHRGGGDRHLGPGLRLDRALGAQRRQHPGCGGQRGRA